MRGGRILHPGTAIEESGITDSSTVSLVFDETNLQPTNTTYQASADVEHSTEEIQPSFVPETLLPKFTKMNEYTITPTIV